MPVQVHVLAHSMGGLIALLCAAEHPDLIDRVVTIAPMLMTMPCSPP